MSKDPKSPTIPLVADDAQLPEIQEIFTKFKGAIGFVPNLVRLWSQAPKLVSAFVAIETTVSAAGRVPAELKELAMARASELNGCPYCKAFHHHRLDELGVEEAKGDELKAEELRASLFSEDERVVLRLADEMTLNVRAKPETVERARALFGIEGTVELMAAIALINFDNRMAYTANIPPDSFG